MDEVLAFDVNETLLDLAALDAPFADALGDAAWRPAWFTTMLQTAFTAQMSGRYVDFSTAQRAALAMVGARAGREPTDAQAEAILGGMRRLPAHPDARPALERLRDAGVRMIALTNSVLDVARAQLAFAGLDDCFEDILSADEVAQLKPGPKPYRMAAERSGVEIGRLRLVAAHAWDVSGALGAGAKGAFVARGGAIPAPLDPRPDVVGPDLGAVAEAILARAGVT